MLEEITDYLIVAEKDDPTLVAELREKFSAVEEPFERLHSVVLQRQARLQNIVINSQDFQLSLSEAQNNLNEFERSVAQLEPISAIYEVVQRQKEDHEVIMNKKVKVRMFISTDHSFSWLKKSCFWFLYRAFVFFCEKCLLRLCVMPNMRAISYILSRIQDIPFIYYVLLF